MKGKVLLRKTVGSAHTLCYGNTDRLSREQANGQEQEGGGHDLIGTGLLALAAVDPKLEHQ